MSMNLLLLIAFGSLIFIGLPKENPGKLRESSSVYPGLGNFLDSNNIKGNMLNQELTGNYVIYRLFPKYKVFSDTRYMNMDVLFDGFDIFYAIKNATDRNDVYYLNSLVETCLDKLKGDKYQDYFGEYWYKLMEVYEIDFIVGRVTAPRSGRFFPFFIKLISDEAWKLVYADGNAVVIIKDNHRNDHILRKYPPMNKKLLYDQAIRENKETYTAEAYETKAFSYLMKGEVDKAEEAARYSLMMDKNRNVAKKCLEFILYLRSGGHL